MTYEISGSLGTAEKNQYLVKQRQNFGWVFRDNGVTSYLYVNKTDLQV